MGTELSPDIVLLRILPRLPAKSAVRFTCVSKEWYSFLTTPIFANMHLHHQNRHKLLFKSYTTLSCTFRTIDCEAPEDGLTPPRYLPFKLARNMSVITSFNGMVCVGVPHNRMKSEYSDLILWNPLTCDYKTLSKTNSCKECYQTNTRASVLYYISSEDDYKLLLVTHSCSIYIYSLKFDLWRKTEDIHRLSFSNHNASLNEKLYFLKEDKADDVYSIISLDLKTTEKFIDVATPILKNSHTTCLGFTILRGCIHIWMRNFLQIDLWRMDGDGDWTKVVAYWGTIDFPHILYQQPLHLMADGNWLLLSQYCLYKTYPEKVYNCACTYTTTRYKYRYLDLGITPLGKYLETLVSPNQYMK
ncbi:putative F-box associated interaction domain, F-box-like domain superfamily [Helianthus annuus]|nr:putative F-box associated interaction domain, F-box-like domain superfamily [Helianthus annuus]